MPGYADPTKPPNSNLHEGSITRGYERKFSCAHFYYQPLWSIEKNQEKFGKCFTEFGHGHDYRLVVYAKPGSDVRELAQALDALETHLDHQHLNKVIPEFFIKIPTMENLALYCLDFLNQFLIKFLKQRLDATNHGHANNSVPRNEKKVTTLVALHLYERHDLWVEMTISP